MLTTCLALLNKSYVFGVYSFISVYKRIKRHDALMWAFDSAGHHQTDHHMLDLCSLEKMKSIPDAPATSQKDGIIYNARQFYMKTKIFKWIDVHVRAVR